MHKILELINQKKKLYEQDLVQSIQELKKMRDEIKKNPEKAPEITMQKYPPLQAKIVGQKTAIKLLLELEDEIKKLNEIEV